MPLAIEYIQGSTPYSGQDDFIFDLVESGGDTLAICVIYAQLSDHVETLLVYDGESFYHPFDTRSTVTYAGGRHKFCLNRVGGWGQSGTASLDALEILATDSSGGTP